MDARTLPHTSPSLLLSIVAPVSSVRPRKGRHTVELRTAPAVLCLLDQPWAAYLQPGDWVQVSGEPWTGPPSTVHDRVVLARCTAAIAPTRAGAATFQVTGTVEELSLHGRSATVLLSFRARGIRTLSVQARPDQALAVFLSGRKARAKGRVSVSRSGHVLYIAEHLDTNTRKEEVA